MVALSQQANAAERKLRSPETKCAWSACKLLIPATEKQPLVLHPGEWVLQDKAEVSTGFLPSSRLHLFLRIAWVCQGARL